MSLDCTLGGTSFGLIQSTRPSANEKNGSRQVASCDWSQKKKPGKFHSEVILYRVLAVGEADGTNNRAGHLRDTKHASEVPAVLGKVFLFELLGAARECGIAAECE